MKTTLIKRSGLGHDVNATCHYIGDYSSKAHNFTLRARYKNDPHNKLLTKRNLALRGIGVPINGWRHTAAAFKRLAKLKPKNSVKTINLVISPSKGTIDPYNIDQVNKLADFCESFTNRWYPHHLAYLAVQCDNRNIIPHCHIIVSALSTIEPHNEMKSLYYENHHLQRAFNQSAKQFNQQQNVIKLGPAVNGHQLKASKTDKWLTQHAKIPLDNLINGKDRSKTALKKDFRAHGIRLKLKSYRHRKHDKNGHVLYRKYKSGKKAGKYIYRKNRNGNRVKIPKYQYVDGVALSPIHKIERNKRHSYVHGSRLAKLTGDKIFNGRFMISVLYKIKHHVPVKSSAATSESASASTTTKSKATQASTASQLASNRNSMMSYAWQNSLSSKVSQRSAQSANHSLAVQKQLRSIKNDYASTKSHIATSYTNNQSLAIQDPIDNITNQQLKLDRQKHYQHAEIKRVMTTLPKISNKNAQLYAAWLYKHAVPTKAIGSNDQIPKVNLKNKDKKLTRRLINPIVREFRLAKIKAYLMWTAGIGAIKTFLHHIGSISGLLKKMNIFNPFKLRKARHFHKIWGKIKNIFNQKFADPAKWYLRNIKTKEEQTQREYDSRYISQVSRAANNSANESRAMSSLASSYSSASNYLSDSNSQWLKSFNKESSSSLNSNSNLRNYEDKMQRNIQAFSDPSDDRPGKLPKAPDSESDGPEI